MTKRWMSLGLVGAAAVVAVGAGAVAVNAAAPGTGRSVLSEDDVARQLAGQAPATVAGGPASVSAAAVTKTVTSDGGTVVAACQGDQAALLRWTPKVGGEVRDLHAGPAPEATITFEIGNKEVTMVATCASGVPAVTVHLDDRHGGGNSPQPEPSDDHGGNRGGGGSGDPLGHH